MTRPSGWLVRHAQSTANIGESQDQRDAALSLIGQKQAQWLSQRIATLFPPEHPHAVSKVIHSAFPRTYATVSPLLTHRPELSTEEWPIHEFINIPSTTFASASPDERVALYQEYWDRNDPFYADGDAEPFADFIERVDQFIEKLSSYENERLLICSHAMFLTATRWRILIRPERLTHDNAASLMQAYRPYLKANFWRNAEKMPFSVTSKGMIRLRKSKVPPSFSYKRL